MSRLATVNDYRAQIATLDAMIAAHEAAGMDFATEVEVFGLRQRRDELAQELASASDASLLGQELDIVLTGKPVVQHKLEAEFMGKILLRVQNLVRSLVAAADASLALTGPFRAQVRRASTLHFAEAFQGSFGMKLEAIQEQPELDGFTEVAPSLDTFVSLLGEAEDPEKVLDRLAPLGPRATTHFRELVSELSSADANMRVRWPTTEGERTALIKATAATKLVSTLKELRESADGRYWVGKLDEASSRKGRFGFTTSDGTVLAGVVESHLIPTLKDFYDQSCKAYILTRELEHPRTGIIKRSHRLQELLPVNAIGQRPEGIIADVDDDE
jgi:hypothetical protein